MSNLNPQDLSEPDDAASQEETSFADILMDFEQQQGETDSRKTIQGVVVAAGSETILLDIGRKTEGVLPTSLWSEQHEALPAKGDTIAVVAGPRDDAGYYQLSLVHVERPKDWTALETAFTEKQNIAGHVTEQVKGGFRVDVGVPAFMPASRSGIRDMATMAQLVGQEIQCRITKLDTAKEDVVVDRRVILEEEQARHKQEAFSTLQEGSVVQGRVRNVMDFGAFVDIGGVDGLLHVADLSWNRIAKASDVVKKDDELTVKILKIDPTTHKVSLGLKQLQDDPWTVASRSFNQGDRVTGTVSRLTDFGAFVELLPGVDGLIHLSEMAWDKRVRKPSDIVKPGDRVDVVILQVNTTDKRIALGLKQAMGDPWEELPKKHPVGSTVEGPITNIAAFGAFVELGDGIEGMIHISDITNEKRLEHPREALTKGQTVRAVVLELDREKRRVRLGMKQLEPTKTDLYIGEHKAGETVTGRVADVHGNKVKVELSEGVLASYQLKPKEEKTNAASGEKSSDVSTLSAMLASRWKQGPQTSGGIADQMKEGQIRNFRILALNAEKRQIELELVG